jgi:pimeloyl-ACP methyl ester carboxylesterase
MAAVIAQQPALRTFVRALVLDSPLLDWHRALAAAAQRHGLPALLVPVTEQALRIQVGLDLRQFSVARQAAALTVPAVVFQGTADTVVPPAVAQEFARDRPDLVTLVRVPGADHVSAVDVDATRYDAALTTFLALLP